MGAFSLGAGFQTSFVVAVLVAVVFLAPKLGGDEELRRRAVQVAIGLSMFLLVFSATNAFIRPPDIPAGTDVFSGEDEESTEYLVEASEKASGAGSVHIGLGILLAVAGAALYRRWVIIPTGLLLGGLLLILLGAPPAADSGGDSLSVVYGFYFSTVGRADQEWDIARFVVLLLGSAVLLGYTFVQLEPKPDRGQGEPPPASDEAPLVPAA